MNTGIWARVGRIQRRQWSALGLALGLGGVLIALLFAGLAPRGAAAAGPGEPAASYPCSQAGLNAALAAGGSATFSCGAPTTVTVSARKTVSHNLSVDGTNTLILQGGTVTGVFSVPAGIHLTLLNFTLRDAGDGAIVNNGVLAVSHAHFISNTNSTLLNQPGGAATLNDASFEGGLSELGQIVNGEFGLTATAALTLVNVVAHDNRAIGGAALVNVAGPVAVLGSNFYSNLSYAGGAIYNLSQLTVRDSQFNFNIASQAILASQAQSLAPQPLLARPSGMIVDTGGAIFNGNDANVIVSSSFFTDNFSAQGGGAIMLGDLPLAGTLTPTSASLSIDNSTFFDNCTGGPGGAVAASQATTVNGSTFTQNFGDAAVNPCVLWASRQSSRPAGRAAQPPSPLGVSLPLNLAGSGGALFSSYKLSVDNTRFLTNSSNITDTGGGGALSNFFGGTLRVTASLFQDNSAQQDGGAIYNDIATVANIGASTFTGNQALNDSGGAIMNVGALTVTASLFRNNGGAPGQGNFQDGGGAIASQMPLAVQANAQAAPSGNGPHGPAGPAGIGPLTILVVDHSSFISNSSAFEGGALDVQAGSIVASTFQSNTAEFGGALDTLGDGLFISASTFIANGAITTTRGIARQGGAIDANSNQLSIQNSTFYLNHAAGNATGGAINQDSLGALWLTNTTFLSNTASVAGNGGALYRGGAINLRNTLLAFNGSENCSGAVTLSGANLEFPGTSCGGASVQANPLALAPANNGGPTLTSALLPGSPARDVAASDAGCPSTDQRGAHRPVGAHCDIGAFEFGGQVPWLWLPLVRK